MMILCVRAYVCAVRACVRACVCARRAVSVRLNIDCLFVVCVCMHACVRASVRACERENMCVYTYSRPSFTGHFNGIAKITYFAVVSHLETQITFDSTALHGLCRTLNYTTLI